MTARRLSFERIRTFWAAKSGTWLAIDFEAWEREHTLLLEFGWSLVRWENGEEVTEDGHMIIKERQSFYNHTWVQGNRDVRCPCFSSVSEIGVWFTSPPRLYFCWFFVNSITNSGRRSRLIKTSSKPVFVSFWKGTNPLGLFSWCFMIPAKISSTFPNKTSLSSHTHRARLLTKTSHRYLRSQDINASIPNMSFLLPDIPPSDGIFVIDTCEMFAALEGSSTKNNQSLQTVCRRLGIPTMYLHNAGNDAHVSLLLFPFFLLLCPVAFPSTTQLRASTIPFPSLCTELR